ncbi:MAG: hypothetical protein JO364_11305, partial [Pseudonocardiales bacterium]|nr:hypothetical protein [Pseudonocardiales bacterium]
MTTSTQAPPRGRRWVDPFEVARPTLWGIARTFDPDRRWFHPVITALWAYALAGVPVWTHLSPWILVPVGLAGTLLGVLAARRCYPLREYGHDQHAHASWLTVLAGLALTTWLVYAAQIRPTNTDALGWLVLGTMVFGGAYAVVRTQAPGHKAHLERHRVEVTTQHQELDEEKTLNMWEEILATAGCEGVRVPHRQSTKAGFTLTIEDNPTRPIKFGGLCSAVGDIASVAAGHLADQGVRLGAEQVRAEETDRANLFLLHVSTANVFAHSIPYPLDRPVGTIRHPIRPGLYEDGEDIKLRLLGVHGVMVGATGSGKSVFSNNVIAEVTHCCDALLWICASDKLLPLIYPWLHPWFAGTTDRPVLDWVAGEDPTRVLQQLAALYQLVKLRNKKLGPLSKFEPTPTDPAIECILEEASDLLLDNSTITIRTFDGKEMNGSQLVNAITRAARSAGVSLLMLTQYGLMDALGTQGNMAKRNITLRVAGKTYTDYDGSATLVGMDRVRTTKLRDHTLLIQPSSEVPRVIPAKAYELDGVDQIAPVAARNTATVPRLPAWLHAELGAAYAGRWLPERLPELAELVHAQALRWPALSSEPSGAVTPVSEELLHHTAVDPDSGDNPGQPPTPEEITRMTADAEQKMDQAIETFRKYGSLGKTMTEVLEAIRAENAPAFISAGQLAFVTNRVDRDGDWTAAGRDLIAELRANPWRLEPIERDGTLGWERATLMDHIRAYLTGVTSP